MIERRKDYSMRRRQAYAIEAYEKVAELGKQPDPISASAPKALEKPVKKGYCRKCGAHVGRGVYGHEQKCSGSRPHDA